MFIYLLFLQSSLVLVVFFSHKMLRPSLFQLEAKVFSFFLSKQKETKKKEQQQKKENEKFEGKE